jgi:hypothetical protein
MKSERPARLPATEATNLADIYGLPLLDWAPIEARLEEGVSQALNPVALTITPAGWPPSTMTEAHTSPASALSGSMVRSGS